MPYTVPTASDFKTAYPAFDDTDDARVTFFLTKAASRIDTSWIEADYQYAIMALAAHLLVSSGAEEGDDPIGDNKIGDIASESFGQMSVSYQKKGNLSSASSEFSSTYGSTVYGREFLSYLRTNKPPIVAI